MPDLAKPKKRVFSIFLRTKNEALYEKLSQYAEDADMSMNAFCLYLLRRSILRYNPALARGQSDELA